MSKRDSLLEWVAARKYRTVTITHGGLASMPKLTTIEFYDNGKGVTVSLNMGRDDHGGEKFAIAEAERCFAAGAMAERKEASNEPS